MLMLMIYSSKKKLLKLKLKARQTLEEYNQAIVITAHVDGDDGALGDSVSQKEVGDPVHHRRQISEEVKMQGRNEDSFHKILDSFTF